MPITNSNNTFKDPAHGGIFYFRPFLIAALICFTALVSAQPKLEVRDAKKNFGFVKRGTEVKNVYEITNTGNQPLIITGVDISCSCTTVDYPKQPVLPGAKEQIVVNFNTTTVYGRQDRTVLITSNDPKGVVKLRYKGIVSAK